MTRRVCIEIDLPVPEGVRPPRSELGRRIAVALKGIADQLIEEGASPGEAIRWRRLDVDGADYRPGFL